MMVCLCSYFLFIVRCVITRLQKRVYIYIDHISGEVEIHKIVVYRERYYIIVTYLEISGSRCFRHKEIYLKYFSFSSQILFCYLLGTKSFSFPACPRNQSFGKWKYVWNVIVSMHRKHQISYRLVALSIGSLQCAEYLIVVWHSDKIYMWSYNKVSLGFPRAYIYVSHIWDRLVAVFLSLGDCCLKGATVISSTRMWCDVHTFMQSTNITTNLFHHQICMPSIKSPCTCIFLRFSLIIRGFNCGAPLEMPLGFNTWSREWE